MLRRLLDGISNSQNSPNQGLRIRDPRGNPLLDGPNPGLRIRDSSDLTESSLIPRRIRDSEIKNVEQSRVLGGSGAVQEAIER